MPRLCDWSDAADRAVTDPTDVSTPELSAVLIWDTAGRVTRLDYNRIEISFHRDDITRVHYSYLIDPGGGIRRLVRISVLVLALILALALGLFVLQYVRVLTLDLLNEDFFWWGKRRIE